MLRSEFPVLPAAAGMSAAASVSCAPSAAAFSDGAASADFAAAFREVRADVMDFVENGSRGDAPSLPSLSLEGEAYRSSARAGQSRDASANGPLGQEQREFLSSIAPWAQEAGERLGVSPNIIAAHAALESGWGQRPLRQADGGDANNLFGIKAGGGWRGSVVRAATTEYEGGGATPKAELFRSYQDRESAFRDYTQLLSTNPRYRSALNAGSDAHAFAQGLAQGGYATDPAYADKLARVVARLDSGHLGE